MSAQLIGPVRYLRRAEIELDLADREFCKAAERDEEAIAPLHVAMLYLQHALLAAKRSLKSGYAPQKRNRGK